MSTALPGPADASQASGRMVRFDTVYMAPRVRVALNSILEPAYARKFWLLVDKLRSGRFDIKGLNVEKLHTRKGKVYSARLNVEIRVIFSMFSREDKHSLVIWDADHHDDAYDRVDRVCIPFALDGDSSSLEPLESWGSGSGRSLSELSSEAALSDPEDLTDGLLLFQVPHYVLSEPDKYKLFERNIDRYLRLTEEQEHLISKHDQAFLVQGSAGTGKTTLALFHALNLYEMHPDDHIFFFTYQDELACVCRCYKVNLVGEEESSDAPDEGGLRVFSYLEFCKHYLRKSIDSAAVTWRWIDREASLMVLDDILRAKSRWARSLNPGDIYSYIYSILKGRFVPGTDRFPESDEDYRRIFKGYGSTPRNLDEIMEIFSLYESRLDRANQKDEADLIRHCYQGLKNTALLSADRRGTWIVIDEIQDFTELEWKSILLFWENKCRSSKELTSFPFLSGDRNQNISRSGFRWQEVDSYVESVLKNLHRPNALAKVQLHKNFRNTLEIFDLGKFIRDRAPEGGSDLGLPPTFGGPKPLAVVGEEADFHAFLREISAGRAAGLPAPLVVLFEDESDLKSARGALDSDDGVFLMSMARSKGMEFEDCILYRLFASVDEIGEDTGADRVARLFDLWYMSVTRARKNLLMFFTPQDWRRVRDFFGGHTEELLRLVDLRQGAALDSLHDFYSASEKYIPNYNVIFLERVKAQESWDEATRTDSDATGDKRAALVDRALRLWKKCRDWAALGSAYKALDRFAEAIPYLKLANLPGETAQCFEALGDYEQAAQFYEDNHSLPEAASCYEKAQHHQRAAELFEISCDWSQAGKNYAMAGNSTRAAACFEKAENWEEAANFYSVRGEWLKAAELYRRSNLYEQAAQMYLKVKDKLDAARCFKAAGEHARAAKLLESLNRWAEAAECCERGGDLERAGKLYAKAGRLKDVAACAEQSGNWSLAAATYERMKSWEKAAHAHMRVGQPAKAAECFENAQDWLKALPLLTELGDWRRLARCCEKLGDLARAAEYYLKVESFNEAAYCYEKGEQWVQAADCYLKAQNFPQAASVLVRLGRRIDAARLYLLSHQIPAALELARSIPASDPSAGKRHGDLRADLAIWAENTGRLDIAAGIYEHLGQLMLAGQSYQKAAMPGRAAACFEKESKFSLAAEMYLQDGQLDKAAACFESARQWGKAAECFEKCRNWEKAKAMYERSGDQEGIRRCQSSSQWL